MVDDIVWSLHIPTNVTFVAHSANSPRPLPLPDPSYLRIHAACCRIAHMSGAAEYFEQIFRDLEGLDVLDEDGQSADTLSLALLRLVPPIASNVEDHAT